jgi:hypothetical protein
MGGPVYNKKAGISGIEPSFLVMTWVVPFKTKKLVSQAKNAAF